MITSGPACASAHSILLPLVAFDALVRLLRADNVGDGGPWSARTLSADAAYPLLRFGVLNAAFDNPPAGAPGRRIPLLLRGPGVRAPTPFVPGSGAISELCDELRECSGHNGMMQD